MCRFFLPLLICLLFLACNQSQNTDSLTTVNESKNGNCEKTVNIAKPNEEPINICLPEFNSYKNCYTIDFVKNKINKLAPPDKFNILAVYESDSIVNEIKKLNSSSDLVLKDYFVVSFDNDNYTVDSYNKFISSVRNSSINKEWEGVRKKINEDVGEGFKGFFISSNIEKPLLVGQYSLSDNSNTFIMLTKFNSTILVGYSTYILFKNRALTVFYYTNYENHETISKQQKNNDYLVQEIININK